MQENKKAFTLVELLVVITILTILATISYVLFSNNLGEARDAKRSTDLNQIVRVLELYETENSRFPDPSNAVNVTYSGSSIAWIQGTFGESVSKKVKAFGMDFPKDPLYDVEYTYSTTNNNQEFQVSSIQETYKQEEGLGQIVYLKGISQVEAGEIETALVLGNYNGFMVKSIDAGIQYFIATPSIISNDLSSPNIIDIITNQKLVYQDFFNLPASYSGFLDLNGGFNFNVSDPLIFSGSIRSLKKESELLKFNTKLQYIYGRTPTESFDKYLSLLNKEGLTSLKSFLARKFKVFFRSYFNCKDILDGGVSYGDGIYIIDPDGDGGEAEYDVYCDMTTDGGGWTRVGDNNITNGNFSTGSGILNAVKNTNTTNEIVALTSLVDGNNYALHQTGNYSSNYEISFDDPTVLKPGYEIRMSLWRSDYGSGAVNPGITNVKLMGGKNTPWTLGTCTSGSSCYFKNFNSKLANSQNFGIGGALTDVNVSVSNSVGTVTNGYLDGGVLFDGYIPSTNYSYKWGIYPYSNSEKSVIQSWVNAGGFLIATNNENTWDPMGEFFNMPTIEYNDGRGVIWDVENINHPLVNGDIGLGIDLRGKHLVGKYAHAALGGEILPGDVILAKDHYAPYAPTVLLRKYGKGYILFVSDDGMFVEMTAGNTFDPTDYETVFAASIITYAVETAAGVNPHEGYAFHNRIYYNDGTFSTNGKDTILDTIIVDDGGVDRIWTYEQTRHKIYKTPENFTWYMGLDANNNKDLYFTGVRLELFYR